MLPRSGSSAHQPPATPSDADETPASRPPIVAAPAWPRRPALVFIEPARGDLAEDDLGSAGPADDGLQEAGPATAGQTGEVSAPGGALPGPETSSARAHMTARGVMVAMFGLFLAADLAANWTGHEVPAGLSFLAACILGPYLVRRHALLQVVAAPPAIFFIALVITQVATAQGTGKHGKTLSVLEGTALILAALAPWLLSGAALGILAAIPRGLRPCTRELKQEIREDLAQRRPWVPRARG